MYFINFILVLTKNPSATILAKHAKNPKIKIKVLNPFLIYLDFSSDFEELQHQAQVYDLDLFKQKFVAQATTGQLVGELSMIYKDDDLKNYRLLSGFCQSEYCISISLDHMVFDILFRDKLKKEREQLAFFIYHNCVGFSQNYTYNKILSNVNYLWAQTTVSKGEIICLEGKESDNLYIVKEGSVSFYKRIARQNYFDQKKFRDYNFISIGQGDFFGEDKLFFKCPNRYSAKVSSIKAIILTISIKDFQYFYKKTMPQLTKMFEERHKISSQIEEKIRDIHKVKNISIFDHHVWSSQYRPKEIKWEKIILNEESIVTEPAILKNEEFEKEEVEQDADIHDVCRECHETKKLTVHCGLTKILAREEMMNKIRINKPKSMSMSMSISTRVQNKPIMATRQSVQRPITGLKKIKEMSQTNTNNRYSSTLDSQLSTVQKILEKKKQSRQYGAYRTIEDYFNNSTIVSKNSGNMMRNSNFNMSPLTLSQVNPLSGEPLVLQRNMHTAALRTRSINY